MACPDFSEPFIVQTDASGTGLGAVLTQVQNGTERVIAYISRTLLPAERNYSVIELECLAVVWAIRKWRGYLEGYFFKVITDHKSLEWLQKFRNPRGKLARWLFDLQEFNFEISYRRGTDNKIADVLSRSTQIDAIETVAENINCPWFTSLKTRIISNPEKFPNFKIIDEKIYKKFRQILLPKVSTPIGNFVFRNPSVTI